MIRQQARLGDNAGQKASALPESSSEAKAKRSTASVIEKQGKGEGKGSQDCRTLSVAYFSKEIHKNKVSVRSDMACQSTYSTIGNPTTLTSTTADREAWQRAVMQSYRHTGYCRCYTYHRHIHDARMWRGHNAEATISLLNRQAATILLSSPVMLYTED